MQISVLHMFSDVVFASASILLFDHFEAQDFPVGESVAQSKRY